MELRPYQNSGIQASRNVLRSGKRRFALYSPTGSGKTTIGMAFIAGALAKGKRVAFIANRIALVGQASKEFTKAGIPHGVIQGENSFNTTAECLICSIQTVARRGLPRVDLIVIDEAHGVPGSKDYLKVIFANNNIPIIGLTATPFSRGMAKTHRELIGEPLFEDIVIAATIRDLIADGYLVDCEIYAPSEPDLRGVKTKRNSFGEVDYDEAALADAVDKPSLIGDIVSHWLKVAGGKPTVCFATNIAHSKHIVEQFERAGVPAGHIDGYMNEAERAEVMGRMERGEIKVLSNVAVLREGWDFPPCEVMILARPTKSLIAWIQMVGRVLRPSPGKELAIVLDHSGSAHELGYPTDDLPLELCDGAARKGGGEKQPKDERKPKKCPKCSFMKPVGQHKCTKCGFEPERRSDVEVGDGELEKVKRSKKPIRRESGQWVFSQLLDYARAHGYQDGWAWHKYAEFFDGRHPAGLRKVSSAPTPEILSWIRSRQIAHAKRCEKAEVRHAA